MTHACKASGDAKTMQFFVSCTLDGAHTSVCSPELAPNWFRVSL